VKKLQKKINNKNKKVDIKFEEKKEEEVENEQLQKEKQKSYKNIDEATKYNISKLQKIIPWIDENSLMEIINDNNMGVSLVGLIDWLSGKRC